MVTGYMPGLNRYLQDVGGAAGVTDPVCRGGGWVQPGQEIDLYYGIYFANLLASAGVFVRQIVDATPPSPTDPGLPSTDGSRSACRPTSSRPRCCRPRTRCSPASARTPSAPSAPTARRSAGTPPRPAAAWCWATRTSRGAGRYRFTQSHLTIPGEYDVAGAMLHGSPVVNIGWNSGRGLDPHGLHRLPLHAVRVPRVPGAPTTYLTPEGPQELERDVVEVQVKREDGTLETVTEDLYRTEGRLRRRGPRDPAAGLDPGVGLRAARRQRRAPAHPRRLPRDGPRRAPVQELAAAQDRTAGIPWVNTLAADRDGNALYADNSVVPNVPDSLVERCATPIGRVLFQLAGLPALAGTLPDCAWRDDADAARPGHLRAGEPAGHRAPRLGGQRERLATGCRTPPSRSRASPASSAASSASGRSARAWSTATCWTASPAPTASAARR